MCGEYEVYYRFEWKRDGEDFVEENGRTVCNAYEPTHAIFRNKCKELSQRVFSICDDDYSYVDVLVSVRREGSVGNNIDSFYFTMEGAEDED